MIHPQPHRILSENQIMNRILVSACLLDEPVRYNGVSVACRHPVLQRWLAENRVISLCPEVAGGLPNRRPPVEIAGGRGGVSVRLRQAIVIDPAGRDLTAEFIAGAEHALRLARENGIGVALLKEGSPSCGVNFTYDGTFSGQRVPASGVTADFLRHAGIHTFSELQIEEADAFLVQLDNSKKHQAQMTRAAEAALVQDAGR